MPLTLDEVGPVFIHPDRCAGAADDGYPGELRGSGRAFRAYSTAGRSLSGVLVGPDGPFEATIEQLFADPHVAVVHARAIDLGCFTFEIARR